MFCDDNDASAAPAAAADDEEEYDDVSSGGGKNSQFYAWLLLLLLLFYVIQPSQTERLSWGSCLCSVCCLFDMLLKCVIDIMWVMQAQIPE